MTAGVRNQQLAEAKLCAIDHAMHIAEYRTTRGTDYVLYRHVTGARDVRLGKSSTPAGILRLVRKVARSH